MSFLNSPFFTFPLCFKTLKQISKNVRETIFGNLNVFIDLLQKQLNLSLLYQLNVSVNIKIQFSFHKRFYRRTNNITCPVENARRCGQYINTSNNVIYCSLSKQSKLLIIKCQANELKCSYYVSLSRKMRLLLNIQQVQAC